VVNADVHESIMETTIHTVHDTAVLKWGNALAQNGWKTFVHLPGYAQPPQIGGYIPDVYAVKGIDQVAIEVETGDSISLEHSQRQIATFLAWAKFGASRRFFVKMA
jgi:Holliday junction resolvase